MPETGISLCAVVIIATIDLCIYAGQNIVMLMPYMAAHTAMILLTLIDFSSSSGSHCHNAEGQRIGTNGI